MPNGPPDDRFLFLSDVLPTAWQAVEYADIPEGGTLLVLGAGPIGDMAARIAMHRGHRTMVADLVRSGCSAWPRRAAQRPSTSPASAAPPWAMSCATGPQGAVPTRSSTRSAWRHTAPVGVKAVQKLVGLLPDAIAEPLMMKAGVDRLEALLTAFDAVRRGGTVSIVGVYGGAADPLPMFQMFDKQVQVRMGQANVRAWTDDILALLDKDEDVLGVETFATHHLSLDEAPDAYETFQKKQDGAVKIVFRP